PNAGKSTLTNALVGKKIAITANQPETTRKVIRGIVSRDEGQLILVDTPGLHRPRTLLGERLNDMVHETLSDVDAVAMCLPADEKIGPGDAFLFRLIKKTKVPILGVITKIDRVSKEALAQKLIEVQNFAEFDEYIPVSAVRDEQVGLLADVLISRMPLSPPLYPQETLTDESDEDLMAEMIREAALEDVRDELPHSIAVTIDEINERAPRSGKHNSSVMDIHASIVVERDSQKGIIIGKGGERLKKVGRAARQSIEELVGRRVYLHLHVRVEKDWQRNPKLLGKLGF
ncbi:MAG: GTPase Era, partial [Arcanobacterium sp.]|nr:GTPase Era [Arcanobacterium sp.]